MTRVGALILENCLPTEKISLFFSHFQPQIDFSFQNSTPLHII